MGLSTLRETASGFLVIIRRDIEYRSSIAERSLTATLEEQPLSTPSHANVSSVKGTDMKTDWIDLFKNFRGRVRRTLAIAIVVASMAMSNQTVSATSIGDLPILTSPNGHGYPSTVCPTESTADTMTITNVVAHQRLLGVVDVQYVNGSSRVSIPASVRYLGTTYASPFSLDETGSNVSLTIVYPPSSEWPVGPDGTQEIHVDLSISVTVDGTELETLGPGQDWDVYCVGSATPESTTPTATLTPTVQPTVLPHGPSGVSGSLPSVNQALEALPKILPRTGNGATPGAPIVLGLAVLVLGVVLRAWIKRSVR
jgi:hypothetical protein